MISSHSHDCSMPRVRVDIAGNWAAKLKGRPLVDLSVGRLDRNGAESAEVFSLEKIEEALSESRRIVLEAPAGRGKAPSRRQPSAESHSVASIHQPRHRTAAAHDELGGRPRVPRTHAVPTRNGDIDPETARRYGCHMHAALHRKSRRGRMARSWCGHLSRK